jgi:UMF1 family MFS transporter
MGPPAETSAVTAGRADIGESIDRSGWSWAIFEWARNPYVILCIIYVLGPYIATVVIDDPVRGQVLVSSWHRTAGLIVAATAPFLGAAADRMGRRKPLLAAVIAILAPATAVQWLAMPGGEGAPLWLVGAAIVVAGVTFAWSEVLHNAMLTTATKPSLLSHVSGLGLALGNAASVLLLVFVLWALALPGQVDWPFLPAEPWFGLDQAAHEPSRIVAPLCAAWLILFSLPLFLYTRDFNTTGERFLDAMRHGVGNVWRTILKLRSYRNVVLFLLARMFYFDGKLAILITGGVYAAGAMDWGLIEMLTYGIVLSVFAVLGGVAGGWLDHWFGPKRAVAIELGVTIICLVAMVSMSADAVFFVVPVDPGVHVWNGPMFQTAPELAYIGFAMVIAVSITAAFASSRSLMARLAPEGMEGEVFGLYAMAGSATAWLGTLMVERFTDAYQSLRIGFGSIALLLIAGFLLLLFVKPPGRVSGQ